jgi:hypothetical protein
MKRFLADDRTIARVSSSQRTCGRPRGRFVAFGFRTIDIFQNTVDLDFIALILENIKFPN